MERLDKLLAKELNLPRTQAKALLRQGRVCVNGAPVKAGDAKCAETDTITVDGKTVTARQFVYIMMNKPQGVICATDGKGETTVLDLLPKEMRRKNLFPAGRLDKDTTGFVLITDDGAFAHDILSPKKHIQKTYLAVLDKPADGAVIRDFENGMRLGEEQLLPAELTVLDADGTRVRVVLRQGIYHQIKRMFGKHGITVTALKRTAMGNLPLDEGLAQGACRYLTEEEVRFIAEKTR